MKKKYNETNKKSIAVYLVLRVLYVKNREKYKFTKKFIPTNVN